jgi:hypothetical protein
MTYESPSAKLLRSVTQNIVANHPERVVWSAERGWHDTSSADKVLRKDAEK